MIHFFGVDGPSEYPASECVWNLSAQRYYDPPGARKPAIVWLGIFSSPESARKSLGERVVSWEEAPNQTWHGHGEGVAEGIYFVLYPGVMNLVISDRRLQEAANELWPSKEGDRD